MQAARSLFQSSTKLQGRSGRTGISKTYLNVRCDKEQIDYTTSAPHLQQKRTMASATTFFDFTPKDSMPPPFTPSDPYTVSILTSLHRKRPTLPALPAPLQSPPHREHGLQMWLHPSTLLSRIPPQKSQHQVSQRLRPPRLPLQSIQQPGPRVQRRDPELLPGQLRCEF